MDLQGALPGLEFSDEDDYDEENLVRTTKKVKYAKGERNDDFYDNLENGDRLDDEPEELELDEAHESDEELEQEVDEAGEENPLLADLVLGDKKEKKSMVTNLWFSKV